MSDENKAITHFFVDINAGSTYKLNNWIVIIFKPLESKYIHYTHVDS